MVEQLPVEPRARLWARRLQETFSARHSGMLSAVLVVSLGSKVLGFVREVYISSHFGVSPITDSFFGVQQLPVMTMNYMAGAFTLAFVPHYVAVKAQGRQREFLRSLPDRAGGNLGCGDAGDDCWGQQSHPRHRRNGVERRLTARFAVVLAAAVIPSALIGVGYSVCHAEHEHSKAMVLAAVPPAVTLMSLFAWNYWPGASLQYAFHGHT